MKKLLLLISIILCPIGSFSQNNKIALDLDVNGAIGLDNLSKYNVGISLVPKINVNNYLFFGVGLGFKYAETLYNHTLEYLTSYHIEYEDESRDHKTLIIPFVHLKYNFSNDRVSPFFSGNVGYTIDVGQNPYKNLEGLYIEPIVGLDFDNGNTKSYLGVGFSIQKHHYTDFYISSVTMSSDKTVYGESLSLSLHMGIAF